MPDHLLSNRSLGNLNAKFQQFTVNVQAGCFREAGKLRSESYGLRKKLQPNRMAIHRPFVTALGCHGYDFVKITVCYAVRVMIDGGLLLTKMLTLPTRLLENLTVPAKENFPREAVS